MAPRGHVQKAHMNYFCDLMNQIEWDLHQQVLDEKRIPYVWNQIARERPRRGKVRLTLRVEEDVVVFFRKFGKGYQERMNDVLAAWMHGRLAALIEGPDAKDAAAESVGLIPRPRLGDTGRREEEINETRPPMFRSRRGAGDT